MLEEAFTFNLDCTAQYFIGTIQPTCPSGKIYFIPENLHVLKPWSDARAICQEAGGDLAKVTTEDEFKIISRLR